jgi:PAS domain S-box-containing protein
MSSARPFKYSTLTSRPRLSNNGLLYRKVFEELKDAVFITTPDGKFVDINTAGVRLFGYDSKDELMNSHITGDLYVSATERTR